MNGDVKGYPPQIETSAKCRGIDQRIKAKTGRFRGNLSGKRVDFSGRTVISPDPNLSIEELGIPIHMAMIMTFPEEVTKINIGFLKKLILNGPSKYPGANAVTLKQSSDRINLLSTNRKKLANEIQ